MIVDRPRPLPECALCGTPTQRRAHRTNGGMCSECRQAYDLRDVEDGQQALPVVTAAPAPRPPDLTNVVVLDTRRKR